MRTLFLITLLLALSPHVLEAVLGPVAEACAQPCPDDDEKGQCAPDCADCTCCGHGAAPSLAALPAADGLVLTTVWREAADAVPLPPEDPDARGVRHVPKAG